MVMDWWPRSQNTQGSTRFGGRYGWHPETIGLIIMGLSLTMGYFTIDERWPLRRRKQRSLTLQTLKKFFCHPEGNLFDLKNVFREKMLVAGAGFEPTTFRL